MGASPSPGVHPKLRRHDVDWLRTLALGLLIIFHIMLSFQSWAVSAGLPQNDELLEEFVPFLSMLAVWRIPLLFMISGMGVRFAMERRDWKELLKERASRILVPFLFGTYVLGTFFVWAMPRFGWAPEYTPTFGHLWFLLNIFLYVVWLLGILIYLKDKPNNSLFRFFSKIMGWPLGLFLFALPLMLEAWLVDPEYFSVYVDNLHGWLLGLICFFLGFVFISTQDVFWPAVEKIRWFALAVGLSLFLARLLVFELQGEQSWLVGLESMSWMLAVIGFGTRYLNRPSRTLSYLNKAVYPVYIVHMPVQLAFAYLLLPTELSAYSKLALLMAGTFGTSLLLYEFGLRRMKWVRPLFGIKMKEA